MPKHNEIIEVKRGVHKIMDSETLTPEQRVGELESFGFQQFAHSGNSDGYRNVYWMGDFLLVANARDGYWHLYCGV